MKKLFPILLIFTVLGCSARKRIRKPNASKNRALQILSGKESVLKEHRLPEKTDFKGNWKRSHQSFEAVQWWVKQDFNGDGKLDYAYLLPQKDGGFSLIVLRTQNEDYEIHWLTEVMDQIYQYGIGIKEPGKYKTAAGKGYGEPGPDDLKEIRLERPALSFFYYEASSSIFRWDPQAKTFQQIWMSD